MSWRQRKYVANVQLTTVHGLRPYPCETCKGEIATGELQVVIQTTRERPRPAFAKERHHMACFENHPLHRIGLFERPEAEGRVEWGEREGS